jgi:hypothetical protein
MTSLLLFPNKYSINKKDEVNNTSLMIITRNRLDEVKDDELIKENDVEKAEFEKINSIFQKRKRGREKEIEDKELMVVKMNKELKELNKLRHHK